MQYETKGTQYRGYFYLHIYTYAYDLRYTASGPEGTPLPKPKPKLNLETMPCSLKLRGPEKWPHFANRMRILILNMEPM